MTPTQARRASLRGLLAIEKAARVRLSASVREASDRAETEIVSGKDPHAALVAALLLLEWLLARDLLQVRTAARREAVRTFLLEAQASELPALVLRLRDDGTLDRSRATAAAKAIAAAWLARAVAFLGGKGADPKRAPSVASEAVGPKVETTARTEPAQAFGDERAGLSDDYAIELERRRTVEPRPEEAPAAADGGSAPAPTPASIALFFLAPMKVWDAMLDACKVCKGLDGTTVPFGAPFPAGAVPGGVHPNCRCVEGITAVPVPVGKIRTRTSEDEAA